MNDSTAPAVPVRLPLVMPRRLAISLLHQAQIADAAGCAALVLARGTGPGLIVDCGAAAAAGGDPSRLAGLAPPGWQTWALFRYRGESTSVPGAAEFAAAAPLVELLLSASLATKGVLQLRAWRLESGVVHEIELRISD